MVKSEFIDVIRKRLKKSFHLFDDVIESVEENDLSRKLPGIASNELGQQLWCVIGARHSYTNALKAGNWVGFSCPLSAEGARKKTDVAEALKESARVTLNFLNECESCDEEFLLDLLEHETQHHGQIIRYLYALEIPIPDSWKKRYSLS